MYKILVINPGSTSTKLAAFQDESLIFSENISYSAEDLAKYNNFLEEYPLRKKSILETLKKNKINLKEFQIIVARGGPLKSLEGGTYRINEKMLDDVRNNRIQSPHISLIAALLAYELASEYNLPSFIADPVSTCELCELAKISGLPEIERKSVWHALNCKAAARKVAKELKKKYSDLNLVVVHLGGGITVSAHQKGRAIDVNNANSEGPFSPERTGTLPAVELIELCFSGRFSKDEMIKKVIKQGGLSAYLGTNDLREIEKRVEEGDKKSEVIFKAMVYQIAKEIGAYSAALKGELDAIVLTGGLAKSENLITQLKEYIDFIAPVIVIPGEDEMRALAEAGLRVLKGEEAEKVYT